jgi:hypothetical protein
MALQDGRQVKRWGRYGLVAAGMMAGVVSVLAADVMRPGAQGWRPAEPVAHKAASVMPTALCDETVSGARRLTCSTQELASLDLLAEQMFAARLNGMVADAGRRAAQQEHEQWQRRVRDACTNVKCLRDAYRIRLAQFGFIVD